MQPPGAAVVELVAAQVVEPVAVAVAVEPVPVPVGQVVEPVRVPAGQAAAVLVAQVAEVLVLGPVAAALVRVDRLAQEAQVEVVAEVLGEVPRAPVQAPRLHRVGARQPPARATASALGRRRVPRWAKHPRWQASARRPAS